MNDSKAIGDIALEAILNSNAESFANVLHEVAEQFPFSSVNLSELVSEIAKKIRPTMSLSQKNSSTENGETNKLLRELVRYQRRLVPLLYDASRWQNIGRSKRGTNKWQNVDNPKDIRYQENSPGGEGAGKQQTQQPQEEQAQQPQAQPQAQPQQQPQAQPQQQPQAQQPQQQPMGKMPKPKPEFAKHLDKTALGSLKGLNREEITEEHVMNAAKQLAGMNKNQLQALREKLGIDKYGVKTVSKNRLVEVLLTHSRKRLTTGGGQDVHTAVSKARGNSGDADKLRDMLGKMRINDIRRLRDELNNGLKQLEVAPGGRAKQQVIGRIMSALNPESTLPSAEKTATPGEQQKPTWEQILQRPAPTNLPERPEAYFNLLPEQMKEPAKVITLPMDKIRNTRARPQGIENAGKYMEASLKGESGKRDPIKVVKLANIPELAKRYGLKEGEDDGTYVVADGNSTFANAQKFGWKNLPVVETTKEWLEQEQKDTLAKETKKARELVASTKLFDQKTLGLQGQIPHSYKTKDALFGSADKNLQQYLDVIDNGKGLDAILGAKSHNVGELLRSGQGFDWKKLCETPGWHVIIAPKKGEKRATEKANDWFKGDFGFIHDIVRGTVAVDSVSEIPHVVSELQKQLGNSGWKIHQKPKNWMSDFDSGYRDVNVILENPDGQTSELQINTKGMLLAKEPYFGHKLYEEARVFQGKRQVFKDIEEFKKKIKDAQDQASLNPWERTTFENDLGDPVKLQADLDNYIANKRAAIDKEIEKVKQDEKITDKDSSIKLLTKQKEEIGQDLNEEEAHRSRFVENQMQRLYNKAWEVGLGLSTTEDLEYEHRLLEKERQEYTVLEPRGSSSTPEVRRPDGGSDSGREVEGLRRLRDPMGSGSSDRRSDVQQAGGGLAGGAGSLPERQASVTPSGSPTQVPSDLSEEEGTKRIDAIDKQIKSIISSNIRTGEGRKPLPKDQLDQLNKLREERASIEDAIYGIVAPSSDVKQPAPPKMPEPVAKRGRPPAKDDDSDGVTPPNLRDKGQYIPKGEIQKRKEIEQRAEGKVKPTAPTSAKVPTQPRSGSALENKINGQRTKYTQNASFTEQLAMKQFNLTQDEFNKAKEQGIFVKGENGEFKLAPKNAVAKPATPQAPAAQAPATPQVAKAPPAAPEAPAAPTAPAETKLAANSISSKDYEGVNEQLKKLPVPTSATQRDVIRPITDQMSAVEAYLKAQNLSRRARTREGKNQFNQFAEQIEKTIKKGGMTGLEFQNVINDFYKEDAKFESPEKYKGTSAKTKALLKQLAPGKSSVTNRFDLVGLAQSDGWYTDGKFAFIIPETERKVFNSAQADSSKRKPPIHSLLEKNEKNSEPVKVVGSRRSLKDNDWTTYAIEDSKGRHGMVNADMWETIMQRYPNAEAFIDKKKNPNNGPEVIFKSNGQTVALLMGMVVVDDPYLKGGKYGFKTSGTGEQVPTAQETTKKAEPVAEQSPVQTRNELYRDYAGRARDAKTVEEKKKIWSEYDQELKKRGIESGPEGPKFSQEAPKVTSKKPWEMTANDYLSSKGPTTKGMPYYEHLKQSLANSEKNTPENADQDRKILKTFESDAKEAHRNNIEAALIQGKKVPSEVLKDYPDLAAKYGQKEPAQSQSPAPVSQPAAPAPAPVTPTTPPAPKPAAATTATVKGTGKIDVVRINPGDTFVSSSGKISTNKKNKPLFAVVDPDGKVLSKNNVMQIHSSVSGAKGALPMFVPRAKKEVKVAPVTLPYSPDSQQSRAATKGLAEIKRQLAGVPITENSIKNLARNKYYDSYGREELQEAFPTSDEYVNAIVQTYKHSLNPTAEKKNDLGIKRPLTEGAAPTGKQASKAKDNNDGDVFFAARSRLGQLEPRVVRNYNSLGSWFTSSPDAAKELYGEHIHVAPKPNGRLFKGSDNFDNTFIDTNLMRSTGLNNEANILQITKPNKKRLNELNKKQNREGLLSSEAKEFKSLNEADKAVRSVLLNQKYMQEFRNKLEKEGYEGIYWPESNFDGSSVPHTVYLSFHKEPISLKEHSPKESISGSTAPIVSDKGGSELVKTGNSQLDSAMSQAGDPVSRAKKAYEMMAPIYKETFKDGRAKEGVDASLFSQFYKQLAESVPTKDIPKLMGDITNSPHSSVYEKVPKSQLKELLKEALLGRWNMMVRSEQ
jgi:hypothetical protein